MSLIYRLRADAGDSAPANKAPGSAGETVVGGTIALIDRGSGDYAWQFSAGESFVNLPAFVLTTSAAAGGVTFAMTLKVVTGPSVDYTGYLRFGDSADITSRYVGFTQNGPNQIRGRAVSSAGITAPLGAVGSTEFTYVGRLSTNAAGLEVLDVWKTNLSRVGDAPDFTVTATAGLNATTFNRVLVGGLNGAVLQVKDVAILGEEKANAYCAAASNDLRGTLDAAPATINLTAANLTGGSSISTGAVTVEPPVAGVVSLVVAGVVGGSSISSAAVTVTPVQGTLTSDIFRAWGSPAALVALTVPRVTVQRAADGVGVLNLADQVTNGAGRLALVNAAIVAGTWYMLGTWDPADPLNNRGFKAYLAT